MRENTHSQVNESELYKGHILSNKQIDQLVSENIDKIYKHISRNPSQFKLSIDDQRTLEKILHNNGTVESSELIIKSALMKEIEHRIKISNGHEVEKELESDLRATKVKLTPQLLKGILENPTKYKLHDSTISHILALDDDGRTGFMEEFNNTHKSSKHHSDVKDCLNKFWHENIVPILQLVAPIVEKVAVVLIEMGVVALSGIIEASVPGKLGLVLKDGVVDIGSKFENKLEDMTEKFVANKDEQTEISTKSIMREEAQENIIFSPSSWNRMSGEEILSQLQWDATNKEFLNNFDTIALDDHHPSDVPIEISGNSSDISVIE